MVGQGRESPVDADSNHLVKGAPKMENMATWEDGPEYAPLTRPDTFSPVDAPPLAPAPPAQQLAAGAPPERPGFAGPQLAVPPLTSIAPRVDDRRDPQRPFDVASSTITSMDSAWGAAHWNAPGSAPQAAQTPQDWPGPPPVVAAPPATAPPWVTPPPSSWPAPTTPFPPVSGPASMPSGYPPPGTNQWFGPGPVAPQQPAAPGPVDAKAVLDATTPGLVICLAIGGFIYLFAPITLGVAFALSSRVKVAQQQVRRVFMLAGGFVGLLAVARFLMDGAYGWWSFVGGCSLVISWLVLVLVLVLTYRDLKSGRTRPPNSPYTSSWG